uniref:Uncharacterized protein n=1 Tax=Strongyloides venezuelensis TaxID=75913 RepID=A0A0K0G5G2_STRVS
MIFNIISLLLFILLLPKYTKCQWNCHYHYDCGLEQACYMQSYGSYCAPKCNFAFEYSICGLYDFCLKSLDESENEDFVCVRILSK